MNTQIQSSFIPKQDAPSSASLRRPKGSFSFLGVVSALILVFSAVMAAGSYGYRYYLNNSINRPCTGSGDTKSCGLVATLDDRRQNIDSNLLNEIIKTNGKLVAAQKILREHIAVQPFFTLLGAKTLKTVRFNSLTFKGSAVELHGVADSYESVAVQSKRIFEEKAFVNPVFSDITLDGVGNVTFRLNFDVSPDLLSFYALAKQAPLSDGFSSTSTTNQ
jgi:hypothetical protein